MSKELSRRSFLKLLGAALFGGVVAGCDEAVRKSPVATVVRALDGLTPVPSETSVPTLPSEAPTLVPTETAVNQSEKNAETLRLIKSFYEGRLDLNGPNNSYRFVNREGKLVPLDHLFVSETVFTDGKLTTQSIITTSVYLGNYTNKNGLLCFIWGQTNVNQERLVWVTGMKQDPDFPVMSKILGRVSLTSPPVLGDSSRFVDGLDTAPVIVKRLEPFLGRLVGIYVYASSFLEEGFCGQLNTKECDLYRLQTSTSMGGNVLIDWMRGYGEGVDDLVYVLPPGSEYFSKLDRLQYTLLHEGVQVPMVINTP